MPQNDSECWQLSQSSSNKSDEHMKVKVESIMTEGINENNKHIM